MLYLCVTQRRRSAGAAQSLALFAFSSRELSNGFSSSPVIWTGAAGSETKLSNCAGFRLMSRFTHTSHRTEIEKKKCSFSLCQEYTATKTKKVIRLCTEFMAQLASLCLCANCPVVNLYMMIASFVFVTRSTTPLLLRNLPLCHSFLQRLRWSRSGGNEMGLNKGNWYANTMQNAEVCDHSWAQSQFQTVRSLRRQWKSLYWMWNFICRTCQGESLRCSFLQVAKAPRTKYLAASLEVIISNQQGYEHQ